MKLQVHCSHLAAKHHALLLEIKQEVGCFKVATGDLAIFRYFLGILVQFQIPSPIGRSTRCQIAADLCAQPDEVW